MNRKYFTVIIIPDTDFIVIQKFNPGISKGGIIFHDNISVRVIDLNMPAAFFLRITVCDPNVPAVMENTLHLPIELHFLLRCRLLFSIKNHKSLTGKCHHSVRPHIFYFRNKDIIIGIGSYIIIDLILPH